MFHLFPFPLAPLHGLFMLLTFLGVILLMVWLVRYAKKETLIKTATWFLIVGIVGCIATMVAAHMLAPKDGKGDVMFFKKHMGDMEMSTMMQKPYRTEDMPGMKMDQMMGTNGNMNRSVNLMPANTNVNMVPVNANQNL